MSECSRKTVEHVGDRLLLPHHLTVSSVAIADFCKRWRVIRLSLFGSVLSDDFGRWSDIDVMVEFEPDGVPGIRFFSMAAELSVLFGRPVDVVTLPAVERSPNHIRRRAILESAEVIYAHDDSYLLDMLVAARKAIHFAQDLDFARFAQSDLHQNAIFKALEIVGEAAARISEQKNKHTLTFHGPIWWDSGTGLYMSISRLT